MEEKIAVIKAWLQTGSVDIFGSPLAGKDTLSSKLTQTLNGALVGGGRILRDNKMPDYIKKEMATGELIPIDDYLKIVMPYLSQEEFRDRPLILNSIGRWHGEEDVVMYVAEQSGHPLKAVIFIQIDEDHAIKRLRQSKIDGDRGQRHDDSETKLSIRLREFKEKTLPVIESYKELGLLIEIDGTKTREEVFAETIEKLYQKASHASASQ